MRRTEWCCTWIVVAAVAGCNSTDGTGPGPGPGPGPQRSGIAVLSSAAGTLHQFNRIDGELVRFGQDKPIRTGGAGDRIGESLDFISDLWVTTADGPTGSKVVFGSFSEDDQRVVPFPDGARTNPGRATVIVDNNNTVAALVPARSTNTIYLALPGGAQARLLMEAVGVHVERALSIFIPPFQLVVVIDSNFDVATGSSRGPPRVAMFEFLTGRPFDIVDLSADVVAEDGALSTTEALLLGDQLVLLAGGSADSVTSLPMGDGTLSEINVRARGLAQVNQLGGNGLSLEPGKNGLAYIVRTKGAGTTDTDVVSFNLTTREFARGPQNPIQPADRDGSDLSCRVVTAFLDGQMLCATYEAAGQGRLVLLNPEGEYMHEASIGAGATDILLR